MWKILTRVLRSVAAMRSRAPLLLAGLLLVGPALAAPAAAPSAGPQTAQPPRNPELIARDYVVGKGAPQAQALRIGSLDLNIDLNGATARTVAVIRFDNPTQRPLEGDFTLDLPAGSVVTGYGLDVDGAMRDGVLIGQRQAKLAYEKKVRQGVDPGIAEVTRANAFHTRIFPVMPGKGRTVRLEFVTPLDAATPYRLPLVSLDPVGALSLTVTAQGDEPRLTLPPGLQAGFTPSASGLEARVKADGAALNGVVGIALPPSGRGLVLTRHHSGQVFFDLEDAAPPPPTGVRAMERVRVYWDRSRSRRDDDVAGEAALLSAYLGQVRAENVDLVLFNHNGPDVRSFHGPDAGAQITALVTSLDYEGATSLEAVMKPPLAPADACLMFSDGAPTLDTYRAEHLRCPLFTVSSAADADHGFLTALAHKSGGEHLDLRSLDPAAALGRLTSRNARVTGVVTGGDLPVDYAVLPSSPGRFHVVGVAPPSGLVMVQLGDAGRTLRTYQLSELKTRDHDGAGALWAADQLAELSAEDAPDQDDILKLSRRYSVAGPWSAFLVLETAQDYADNEVVPPATLSQAFLADYRNAATAIADRKRAERDGRLKKVVALWTEQKAWWNTTFKPVAPGSLKPRNDSADTAAAAGNEAMAPAPPPPPPPPPAPEGTEVGAVVVTGSRIPQPNRVPHAPLRTGPAEEVSTVDIEAAPWNPDRPYLKALDAASADGFEAVYRAQDLKFGDTPAFYLDVSEWLFRHGRADQAIEVVLNALELPNADITTLTLLAERLQRYGDGRRAFWIYDRILRLQPDLPQPRRNLALALIRRAEADAAGPSPSPEAQRRDYARALDLLNEVATRPWSDAYDGIEVISLMEANRIIPRARALGLKEVPLDPRLIALMDVDLRLVLEWNTDITDMDLWVDEPSGEQAIYSYPKTRIGGRLSNDMTQGYGPEEYLLHRAPDGTYTIRVNVYRADQLNPNGAITIRVRLIRGWARADEKEQTLEVELKPDQSGAVLVGTARVGPGKSPAPSRSDKPR